MGMNDNRAGLHDALGAGAEQLGHRRRKILYGRRGDFFLTLTFVVLVTASTTLPAQVGGGAGGNGGNGGVTTGTTGPNGNSGGAGGSAGGGSGSAGSFIISGGGAGGTGGTSISPNGQVGGNGGIYTGTPLLIISAPAGPAAGSLTTALATMGYFASDTSYIEGPA